MGASPFPLVLKGKGVPPQSLWPGLAGESYSRGLEQLQPPPASSDPAGRTQHTLPWSRSLGEEMKTMRLSRAAPGKVSLVQVTLWVCHQSFLFLN